MEGISLNDIGILSTMAFPFLFRAVKELDAVLPASGYHTACEMTMTVHTKSSSDSNVNDGTDRKGRANTRERRSHNN